MEKLMIRDQALRAGGRSLLLLGILFLLGSMAGTLVGSIAPGGASGQYLALLEGGTSFPDLLTALLAAFWLPALSLALATSFLGFVFLPAVAFIRGYLISCSLAALLAGGCAPDAVCVLVVVGPALFSVPALFLLCDGAFSVSRRFYASCVGRPAAPGQAFAPGAIPAAVLLLLSAAAIQQFVIPLIL